MKVRRSGLRERIGTLGLEAGGGFLLGKAVGKKIRGDRRPRSLPSDKNRAAGVAHNA